MRGDIIFWPSDGTPVSRLIAYATAGPFVHVSVDMGDGTDIGAHSEDGVQRRKTPDNAGIIRFSAKDYLKEHWTFRGEMNEDTQIERGIQFLLGEIGNKYGWSNIFNNVLKFFRIPYRVSRTDRYDCSSLVTRYCEKIGIDMGDLGEEPDSVSPNDLARALKLI